MKASVLVLLTALALGPQVVRDETPPTNPPRDLRSWELLDYDCSSDLGRHRTTLFANGTVRLKIRDGQNETMVLRELSPAELSGYLNRLREEDLSETESSARSAGGEWVDRCELTLDLGDRPMRRFSFGRYDSVSLALSRVVGITDEIIAWAEEEVVVADFPEDYEPRPGDILKRRDGTLFKVIALTSDKRGVELWGVEQPLVIYVLREEVVGEFVALVERSRPL